MLSSFFYKKAITFIRCDPSWRKVNRENLVKIWGGGVSLELLLQGNAPIHNSIIVGNYLIKGGFKTDSDPPTLQTSDF